MIGFIDQMRAEGHAAWSICRVLREQGVQIAARSLSRPHISVNASTPPVPPAALTA